MFKTNVSRGVVVVLIALIVILTAMAFTWVGSGQFTWEQVAEICAIVLLIIIGFGVGIWWVSKGEGWDDGGYE